MHSARTLRCVFVLTLSLVASVALADNVTVQPSDTLWGIARAHGTTVEALKAANGLTGDALRPGMTLRLPGGVATEVGPGPAPTTYRVETGDTLYDIAQAHRVSVDDLIVWNELDGTLIRPGQVLTLHQRPGTVSAAPLVVTVQPGHNLWQLARAHDTTVAAIASANGLDANAVLRIGQTLTIPGRYAPVTAEGFDATPDLGGPAPATVTVARGDSLWQIANRHETSVAALMSLNGLATDRLQVGQTLRVMPGTDLGRAQDALNLPRPEVPTAGMVWPLVGPITSRFGYRRLRIGGTNMHYGLDIDGDLGDPIRAAVGGVVTFAGWRGGFGKLVVVENGDTEYFYAHASALLVSEGQRIDAGHLIARVGATGHVTGPHLHFEIRVDGVAVDPLPILEARASR